MSWLPLPKNIIYPIKADLWWTSPANCND